MSIEKGTLTFSTLMQLAIEVFEKEGIRAYVRIELREHIRPLVHIGAENPGQADDALRRALGIEPREPNRGFASILTQYAGVDVCIVPAVPLPPSGR